MHKLKLIMSAVLVTALVLGGLRAASADSSTVTGRWAGTAFANPSFDFNHDGIAARTFSMTVYGQFASMEGVVDTALVSFGVCAPGALELQPFGSITFRDRTGEGLFVEVPLTAPHLCFDPANPSEVIAVSIVGGTGPYANAVGTGTLVLHDIVRLTTPATLPGVGVVPAPTMVDSRGEFTLNIQ